uniref:Uncharacterized protein n=1 Tax=Amphimedon queenslandica TaxID=400682 RepID=A0A1X7V8T7_AMPQE
IKLKEIEKDQAKDSQRSELERYKITAQIEKTKAENLAKEEQYKAEQAKYKVEQAKYKAEEAKHMADVEQAKYKAEEAKYVADAEKYQLICRIAEGKMSPEVRRLLNLIMSSEASKVSDDRPELYDNGNFDCYDTLASETIPEGY